MSNVRDNKLRFRDFGHRCSKISDLTIDYLQINNKKKTRMPAFSKMTAASFSIKNDANYWVLTQDEFLFDELHTTLQKTQLAKSSQIPGSVGVI